VKKTKLCLIKDLALRRLKIKRGINFWKVERIKINPKEVLETTDTNHP
jgi:hypothetical protein